MKKFLPILLVIVISLSMLSCAFAFDYNDYDYDYDSYELSDGESMALAAGILGVLATAGLIGGIISLAISVLTIIAMWKIFVKAGEEGWKAIIPIYNAVIMFKIVGLSPWLLLISLAAIIPFIGWLAVLALMIVYNIKLAEAFGKSGGFAVGLILLNTIFIMILGFGDAQYVGNGSTINDTFYGKDDNSNNNEE